MRTRFSLVAFVGLGLLAGCAADSENSPNPYVQLVGSTRYTSTNRVVATAGDTLTTRVYAEAADKSAGRLQRLRITVTYEPVKNPILYPPNYDPTTAPKDPEFVYLDSVLTNRQALAFQFTFGARTTSGRELWKFEAEDDQQRTSSRSFRLTLRNGDSALVYHRYSVRLQRPRNTSSRSFLALLPGLAFPSFTVRRNPAAQDLIDLVYLPTTTGEPALASLTDPIFTGKLPWVPHRATQLRPVADPDSTSFPLANTNQLFQDIFNRAQPVVSNTGALRRRQTIAFLTADQRYGLIRVQEIRTSPTPTLNLEVRIAK